MTTTKPVAFDLVEGTCDLQPGQWATADIMRGWRLDWVSFYGMASPLAPRKSWRGWYAGEGMACAVSPFHRSPRLSCHCGLNAVEQISDLASFAARLEALAAEDDDVRYYPLLSRVELRRAIRHSAATGEAEDPRGTWKGAEKWRLGPHYTTSAALDALPWIAQVDPDVQAMTDPWPDWIRRQRRTRDAAAR